MGGKPFTKTSLHKFLTNSTCAGKLRYKTELHSGEHPAIVDPHKWQKVQELLHGNRLGGALLTRNGSGAILKGLLRCRPCGCAMTPTHATKGGKRYRYYVCSNAQKRGSDCCPSQSVPAGQMERIVVEQIAKLGQDPERLKTILTEASKQRRTHLVELAEARRSLEQELARAQALTENLRQETGDQKQQPASEQEAIRENIGHVEQRLADTKKQALAFQQRLLDVELAAKALLALDQEFGSLPTIEQARLIRLMVQRVDYDGAQGKLALTLDPAGLATVVVEQIQRNQEAAK
jgi:site-specific DNA recombinase